MSHSEINITGFGKFAGINPTLVRDYVNGFKKPSLKRVLEIQDAIRNLGAIYSKVDFQDSSTVISHRVQSKPKR